MEVLWLSLQLARFIINSSKGDHPQPPLGPSSCPLYYIVDSGMDSHGTGRRVAVKFSQYLPLPGHDELRWDAGKM